MIVAIDGPAGAGKSTVAKQIAARLGFVFLDTGALYRAVALETLRRDADPVQIAAAIDIHLGSRVLIGGLDVTEAIRSREVTSLVPEIAGLPRVRAHLLLRQREILHNGGDWVAEGRDIGTVVAPDADVKVFLTATPERRAERRALESGHSFDEVLQSVKARDDADMSREHSPLRQAEDAIVVDATDLAVDEVVDRIVGLVPGASLSPQLFASAASDVLARRRRGR